MSADFINGIGASRSPQIRESYGVGPRPNLGGVGQGGETSGAASAPAAVEGFSPTPEAAETSQDRQAGEARASAFSSAWSPDSSAGAAISGGSLKIEGAANTAVSHQVHGVQNGQHVGSGGPEAGLSEATVYKSGPPV